MKIKILQIFFLSIYSASAFAQAPKHDDHHEHEDSASLAKDSARVTFCYAHDHTEQPNDTFTLTTYRFNPLQQQTVPYAFLGNIGSPYTPLVYAPRVHSGLDLGFHQYDFYLSNLDEIRFYDAPRAFTEAFYTQAGTQEQGTLRTKLARSLGKHWSASFRYDIFNQKGVFQQQRPRHTHVSLAVRYRSPNDTYQIFMSGIDNSAVSQHSGGYILTGSNITASGRQTAAIPSFNTAAVDTQKRQAIQVAQFLKITKGFQLAHTVRYAYERYVFSDKKPHVYNKTAPIKPDSTFYRFAYDDKLGVNLFLQNKCLANTFQLQSPTDTLKKLQWSAGLRHTNWWTYQEPFDTTYQNLFAIGGFKIQPLKPLKIAAEGAFGLAFRNAADYHVKANADLDLGKIGRIEGFLLSQRYAPTILQTLMQVDYKTAWRNDFQPTYENTLGAAYTLPLSFLYLKGGIENHTILNYIYNNTTQRPAQATNALNIAQIKIDANVAFKHFHLDNKIILQTMNTTEYMALPSFWSRHSLYWQGKLFKNKLNLRGGIDASLTDAYYAQGYNPLSGEFYVQNTQKLTFYPQVDAHVNFTISKFNGFVLYENLYNAFTDSLYQSVPNYPMRGGNFRFGILWRFLD